MKKKRTNFDLLLTNDKKYSIIVLDTVKQLPSSWLYEIVINDFSLINLSKIKHKRVFRIAKTKRYFVELYSKRKEK